MRNLFLFLAATSLAPITAAIAAPKQYSAKSFFDTTSYGLGAQGAHIFSPDGKSLLTHNDRSGVFNVYTMPLDGGTPKQLTRSTSNATFAVSYFPSDARVLYTADVGGNELDHLFVLLPDGTSRDLTPGDKVKADFLGWSADGRNLYIASNARDPKMFDVLAIDATTYASNLLFKNEGFAPGAISDDGRWLALTKERTSADNNLYLADLNAGTAPKLITKHSGNVAHTIYSFSPDGKSLIFGTNEKGEFTQAWAHDLSSAAVKPVLAADWDVSAYAFSPRGRYRVSAVNADGSTKLALTNSDGKPVVLAGVPTGDLGSVRFSRDESKVAFLVASDTSPNDVFVANLADGKASRLTKALNPAIKESDLVEASVARFKSYDGLEVPGILYRPHQASAANPAPAVVWVHGGPGGQSRRGYSATVQHLVNHGYAVYAINNRGSSGYGKTFFHLDDRKHGDVDLKDVVASKAFLQGLDWVADDRIAIMGGSYGGYMVAAALAFQPKVFDAGIDIFGVTNWERTLKSIPPWWASFKESLYDEMGDPASDETRHRAISPLFHASKIERPLLVIQGANDPRVLKVESDELVAAVKANKVPVDYVVFPDEGHGFLRKQNRIDASEAYLRFLDKHIRGKAN